MKILKFLGIGLLAFALAYAGLALALVYWPVSIFKNRLPEPAPAHADYPHTEERFLMRDGQHLFARVFGPASETAILLVHGFGVTSAPYSRAASEWAEASGARVIALDLRGHGQSDGKPGRLDYFGEYETDLADVIAALRKEGARKIILAGHSMGGGIVLTYALKPGAAPDAYLLISPLLGNNAPTAPATGGPAAVPSNLYVRTPRIIGELMLTLIGIHAFDDLPVMYLNQTPPMTYGFTAIGSMGPRDYRAALRAIKMPLLLIAGTADEVFRSNAYPDVIKQYSTGQTVMVPGATHTTVLADPVTVAAVKSFVETVDAQHRADQ